MCPTHKDKAETWPSQVGTSPYLRILQALMDQRALPKAGVTLPVTGIVLLSLWFSASCCFVKARALYPVSWEH